MSRIAQIIASALAVLASLTWEFINGSWRLVRSLVVSQPPHVDPAATPRLPRKRSSPPTTR